MNVTGKNGKGYECKIHKACKKHVNTQKGAVQKFFHPVLRLFGSSFPTPFFIYL